MGRPAGSTPKRKRTRGQNISTGRRKRTALATTFERAICVAPLEMPLRHMIINHHWKFVVCALCSKSSKFWIGREERRPFLTRNCFTYDKASPSFLRQGIQLPYLLVKATTASTEQCGYQNYHSDICWRLNCEHNHASKTNITHWTFPSWLHHPVETSPSVAKNVSHHQDSIVISQLITQQHRPNNCYIILNYRNNTTKINDGKKASSRSLRESL
jgi:hypothetical protein